MAASIAAILGYLERRADPVDGRAKLIFPTSEGRRLLEFAGREVAALEHRWRSLLPAGEFDRACRAFDQILRSLAEVEIGEARE